MNTRWLILLTLLAASVATAAPPPPEPAFDEPPPGPPPPHVQRFFEVMRERDPEEFERMRQLRESDPAAFRAELGERLRKARERQAGGDFKPTGQPGEGPGPHRRPRRDGQGDALFVNSPELRELEAGAGHLIRQIRELEAGPERSEAIASLRDTLTRAFDLRQQLRRTRVAEMKERLLEVESLLDKRELERAQVIEHQLSVLIGGDEPTP